MLEKKAALELAQRFADAISAGDVDRLDEIRGGRLRSA